MSLRAIHSSLESRGRVEISLQAYQEYNYIYSEDVDVNNFHAIIFRLYDRKDFHKITL